MKKFVIFGQRRLNHIVRDPAGLPCTPPPLQEPTTVVPKWYLRVSQTQPHLCPGQPLGRTRVISVFARLPPCIQPVAD